MTMSGDDAMIALGAHAGIRRTPRDRPLVGDTQPRRRLDRSLTPRWIASERGP